ncbi:MAG: nucleoside deaminase, partial [Actinomycetota bacterium]|nr:nucleoside deaminase [Actinomycetota bacterium]
ELQNDPTAHAEVLAIRDAARKLGTSRLDGATLVSTLEPCPMCAGAALSARISRVVFGAEDPKAGALGSLYQLGSDPRLNHEFSVTPRVLQEECGALISRFFSTKRD